MEDFPGINIDFFFSPFVKSMMRYFLIQYINWAVLVTYVPKRVVNSPIEDHQNDSHSTIG